MSYQAARAVLSWNTPMGVGHVTVVRHSDQSFTVSAHGPGRLVEIMVNNLGDLLHTPEGCQAAIDRGSQWTVLR